MKLSPLLFFSLPLSLALSGSLFSEEAPPENLVLLNEQSVKNLGLKTAEAAERDFENTAFAIGRIEEIPARHSSVSSRISGRAIDVRAFEGDFVKAGDLVMRVESRQPGNPPPTIDLHALKDGIVIKSSVHIGMPVEPEQELLDISDRSEVWAVAQIPEQVAAKLKPGSKARVTIPALSDKPVEAELRRYGVTANREGGTVAGVFVLPNPDNRLVPGMRAEFQLLIDSKKDVLAVPVSAVQGPPTNRVVYVKDFNIANAFQRLPVVTGASNDQFIEIVSGLFPGDEVVTDGSYSLGFAGSGNVSLREALDAAHGHKHAEDGSELTDNGAEADGHDHESEGKTSAFAPFALISYAMNGVLLLLLIVATRRKTVGMEPQSAPETSAKTAKEEA